MSHISKIELEVKDLGILGQACSELGLELIRNQKPFGGTAKNLPVTMPSRSRERTMRSA